jgi:thiamine biosynthesis protein ThiS
MRLWINGESEDHDVANVAEFVKTLAISAPTLLIEHNGVALRREEWPQARLAEGDRLEVLRIAAGG